MKSEMVLSKPAKGLSQQDEAFASPARLFVKKLLARRTAVIAIATLAVVVLACVVGPVFYTVSTSDTDIMNIKSSPSREHPLGTDDVGRDVLARLFEGGKVSLLVGVVTALIQLLIGVTVGLLGGYFGGWLDSLLMRLVDVVMCFPFFVIAVSLAAILGPSTRNVILIIGFLQWCSMARMVRAETMSLKSREYITAGMALGVSRSRILIDHLLPGILPRCVVVSTTDVSIAILSEAALSFLGLGVQAPQSSWGTMLSAARNISVLSYNWWMWLPAGLLIILVAVSVNLLGNAMHDACE